MYFNMMFPTILIFLSLVACIAKALQEAEWVLTTHDKKSALSKMPNIQFSTDIDPNLLTTSTVITIDDSVKYQSILGIGSSLESSTAFNLMRLDATARQTVLQKLFSETDGIGFNLMRITIGTSDFCTAPYYSYDDLGVNETDISLSKFSTSRDEEFIIPSIQQAIATAKGNADELLWFASPWSPPGWMKTPLPSPRNDEEQFGSLIGGTLSRKFFSTYSMYLSKFVRTYKEKYGIPIYAITPQNEPLANQTYPSNEFPPGEEATLIAESLGSAMQKLGTQIWCFDHNWNTLWYPERILNDTEASPYVQGTGFHGYRGKPSDMTTLHEKFPDKDIYFTEGSTFGMRGAKKVVNILRNWSRSYSAWVTILDTKLQPNEGPFNPQPTMIQIDADSLEVIYNLEYYMYGQFSKFVKRGAVRIGSTDNVKPIPPAESEAEEALRVASDIDIDTDIDIDIDPNTDIAHVAFEQNGKVTIVVVNEALDDKATVLSWKGMYAIVTMPKSSVATFSWSI